MRPRHPAAGRLHLDMLWWTAGAETSERGIHRRAYHVRSSRLPSLPSCARRDLTPFSWLTACLLRSPTVLHAVAPAINGDDLGMMQEPVEQGRGKHLVSEELSPSGKAGVGSEQDGTVLIARGDQLKEMVRLSCCEFGVAHLINHQHAWGGVATKPLTHQAGIGGRLQCLR